MCTCCKDTNSSEVSIMAHNNHDNTVRTEASRRTNNILHKQKSIDVVNTKESSPKRPKEGNLSTNQLLTAKRRGRPKKLEPSTPPPKRAVGRPKKTKFDTEAYKNGPGRIGPAPGLSQTKGCVFNVELVKFGAIPEKFKPRDNDIEYVDFKPQTMKKEDAKGIPFTVTGMSIEKAEIYESDAEDSDPENINLFLERLNKRSKTGRGGGKAGTTTTRQKKSTDKSKDNDKKRVKWTERMLMTLGSAVNGERDRLRGRGVKGASRSSYYPSRTFCWERVAGMCFPKVIAYKCTLLK